MRHATVLILLAALALLPACQGKHTMGAAVQHAVASQTLNPESGGQAPVTGVSGKAAQGAMKAYGESFGQSSCDSGGQGSSQPIFNVQGGE
jgi:hypothetical protein